MGNHCSVGFQSTRPSNSDLSDLHEIPDVEEDCREILKSQTAVLPKSLNTSPKRFDIAGNNNPKIFFNSSMHAPDLVSDGDLDREFAQELFKRV